MCACACACAWVYVWVCVHVCVLVCSLNLEDQTFLRNLKSLSASSACVPKFSVQLSVNELPRYSRSVLLQKRLRNPSSSSLELCCCIAQNCAAVFDSSGIKVPVRSSARHIMIPLRSLITFLCIRVFMFSCNGIVAAHLPCMHGHKCT
jgi:hypothetical protein